MTNKPRDARMPPKAQPSPVERLPAPPGTPCVHAWQPTPADPTSAMALVGTSWCLKCRKRATEDDMRAFGRTLKVDDPYGMVVTDYDALRST